ncbi:MULTISPECIES: EAL and HDOD domain-containing protein [Legionella]|uniref:Putative Diguanylate phosphodiesterase (EAL domain) n=1 Tax=Legionella maceachernii TaxID=466 RepID=A0A0W0VWA2_9GAMM|nr:HDOD domain-containing protein [Legionella maceachernii]KTD24273.1 putative Diguanylate phosphodiesterase (EAL domain) [Legionella maceachernii]SKA29275.1 EAL and modified HD-GYP domain-containing signal transduction protein [Legionella maceachernii]SUO98715.1 EAL domain [Legionella maceachernii]
MSTLIARQAIYDAQGAVCAYELLYRTGELCCSNIDISDEKAGDDATASVLSHLFTHSPINTIIGSHTAYINFTRNHLLQQIPAKLPKERIVIELLENIFVDAHLLKTIALLAEQGYKFALDDFVFRDELIPLVHIAETIKIDVLGLSKQDIKKQLRSLKEIGFKGKLLAEKIENRDQLILCQNLGFDLFQGFFLNYPNLVKHEPLSESELFLLELFAELYNPGIEIHNIEEILLKVPQLNDRILKLANSISMPQGKKIHSLTNAIQQLGFVEIRNWVSFILVSALNHVAYDLLERTLIRAKMCQCIAIRSNLANPDDAYAVGMFSTLDAILNEPMSFLLHKIPLSDEVSAALLRRGGTLGYLLDMVQAYEQGNFSKLEHSKFSSEEYSSAYLEAITYSNKLLSIIH